MSREAVLRCTPRARAASPIASTVRRSSNSSRMVIARSTAWHPETAGSTGPIILDDMHNVHTACTLRTLYGGAPPAGAATASPAWRRASSSGSMWHR